MAYNRYAKFEENGTIKTVPFIEIPNRSSDKYVYYEIGKTRLDILSYNYYGDSDYGWVILQANPEYSPYEFMIPNGAKLRIPYPIEQVISQYEADIDKYYRLNSSK